MGRKLVFVAIKVFISEQLTQCAMAFGVVAVVVAAHLVCHPFKLDLYDLHAEVLGVVECLIIFLGVLVLQREERLAADPTDADFDPKIVGDPSEPSGPAAFGCMRRRRRSQRGYRSRLHNCPAEHEEWQAARHLLRPCNLRMIVPG